MHAEAGEWAAGSRREAGLLVQDRRLVWGGDWGWLLLYWSLRLCQSTLFTVDTSIPLQPVRIPNHSYRQARGCLLMFSDQFGTNSGCKINAYKIKA